MNGLPKGIDLTPLKGRQLVQLCFGAWNVAMLFDGSVRVVVESSVLIANPEGGSRRIEDLRAGAAELCGLVGLEVVGAERSETGGMTLHLSSGLQVEIENSRSEYESFQLHIGDQVFVA